jgi:hypothetical protein
MLEDYFSTGLKARKQITFSKAKILITPAFAQHQYYHHCYALNITIREMFTVSGDCERPSCDSRDCALPISKGIPQGLRQQQNHSTMSKRANAWLRDTDSEMSREVMCSREIREARNPAAHDPTSLKHKRPGYFTFAINTIA